MSFRITTNMMKNTYQYNLMNSTNKVSDARDKVLTQRNFNSYAEDPAAATQAFRLRRALYQTNSQINNTKDVYSKFNTAWQNIQGMLHNMINAQEKMSVIRGENDPTGEARRALAQILRSTSESMIQGFNQELGGHFIFAGNDGLNAPFTWKGETLYYRGIDVNSGGMEKPTAAEPQFMTDWKAAIDGLSAAIDADPTAANVDDLKAQRDEALAWYNYYNHEGDKPESTLADDHYLNALLNGDASAATGKDAEWVQYYMHYTEEPPTADDPAENPLGAGWGAKDENGIPTQMPMVGKDDIENGWIAYYTDQANYLKLKEMSEEEMYIDLGMGAEELGANNPLRGTYFNSAISGLNYTDFGVDEDGDPKNFAILMRELADVFDTWDEDGQRYLPPEYQDKSYEEIQSILKEDGPEAEAIRKYHEESQAKAYRLMDKLKAAQETLTAANVELDARSKFLQTNQTQLELQSTNLNMEILDVEQVDLAAAITDFSWDMYCYNAALKIGNQLLSQSLIDYMR